MNKIEPQYVAFEIAKLLKKKGFDEECLAIFNDGEIMLLKETISNSKFMTSRNYSAPEIWQVVEWALEKHNCFLQVISFNTDKQMKFKYQLKRYEWDGSVTDDVLYDTPNQAYKKGISHFLTII